MARIPYPDLSALPPKAQEFQARINPNVNIFRMIPWAETVFPHWHRLGNAFLTRTALDPILREMAIVRTGHLRGSTYEVHQHNRISARIGMAAEKIAALAEGASSDVFDETEKLVLRFTDEVVKDGKATDATFAAAAERFSNRELCELTLVIGFYIMVSAFLETLEIELEADEGATDGALPNVGRP